MSNTTPTRLAPSFAWLNVTQFLGALNDNVFKLFATYFIITLRGPECAARVMGISGVVFVLPFLLFSAGAGVLADRYSKRDIIIVAKALEIGAMLLGVAAFLLRSEFALYAVMFLMSTQSALFGPSKYGIVPELAPREQLSRANGLLTMFTYLAIILGTAAAPFIGQLTGFDYRAAQRACVGISALGFAASLFMRRTPAAGTPRRITMHFVRDIWLTLRRIRGDHYLLLAVIASGYFTLLGAFLQLNIIPYGIHHLGLSQENSTYLFLFGAIGIAFGAVAAGKISGRTIELGIVPLGAVILVVSVVSLYFVGPLWRVAPVMALAGLGAGLFIVPLDAFIQFRAPPRERGEILAASAFLGWVGALLAAALVILMGATGMTPAAGFLLMGLLTLALTIFTMHRLPDFLLRFLALLLTRPVFRIRVSNSGRVPQEGGALIVCLYASWKEALLLQTTQQRHVRFLLDRGAFQTNPWPVWLLRPMEPILFSFNDAPEAARRALDKGGLLCLLLDDPTRVPGATAPAKAMFEHLTEHGGHPVIPAHLDLHSGAGHDGKTTRTLMPRRRPVHIFFSHPLSSHADYEDLRDALLPSARSRA